MILLRHRRPAGISKSFGFAVAIVLCWGVFQPAVTYGETRIIPSAYTNGRYDSNIFVAPPNFVPEGQRSDDLVGTVGGRAALEHRSREVDANLTVAGDFNAYVFSTPLNYVTTLVQGNANLDRWVERLGKGARLNISETFRYTPEAPGFATGAGAEDPFLRGIQTLRANTFSNTASVNGQYPLLGRLALQGSYLFSVRRVGSILASTGTLGGATFFNTNLHTWSVGPQFQLAPSDSITLLYRQGLAIQTRASEAGGETTINTNAQSLTATYAKVMPGWKFELAGGAVLIEPASLYFPTGRLRISNNPERSTTISIQGSRQAAPSFFLFAGALISNVGQIEISHRFSPRLTLQGNASYAFNQSVPVGVATFHNFAAGATLQYALTRMMTAELFYNYTDIDYSAQGGGYQISRNLAGVALTVEWRGEE